MRRGPGIGALLIGAAALCGPAPLAAQGDTVPAAADTAHRVEAAPPTVEARRGWTDPPASPLLPPEHWAVRAAARAEALGLADGYLPPQRAVPRAVVYAALVHAASRTHQHTPHYELTIGWLERFREEFTEFAEDGRGDPLLAPVNGRASAGWADEAGRLSPAVGYQSIRQDPQAVPDVSTPRLELAAATRAGRRASAFGVGRWDERGVDLARWEASLALGPVGLSVGKQAVAYGWNEGGGVVLSSTVLPRVEAQTLRPIHLPGPLRLFGGVSLHTFASRTGGSRHPDEPWLWGARLSFQPHRRLSLAIDRAALFGGDEPVRAGPLLGMLVGVIRNSTFENQVLSFEGRWRLPTERVLAATLYAEWGADDGAGALDEVPGRSVGVYFPAIYTLHWLPMIEAGAEYAHFESACCGHGPWYFNYSFPGNWARGTRPLGHPLGGEGWEAAGYARTELRQSRLRLELRAFVRERADDSYAEFAGGNLFSPTRTGRSTGFHAVAAWRFAPRGEVRAAARREAGDGWRERALDAGLTVFF